MEEDEGARHEVDVACREEENDDLRDAHHRDDEILRVDEFPHEDVACHRREVEDIRRPVDASQHGGDGGDRHYDLRDEMEGPCGGYGFLADVMILGVVLEPVVDTFDGEDARELHHPPYQQLYGEQRIACPRREDGDGEDDGGDVGIVAVVLVDVGLVPASSTARAGRRAA